MQLEADADRATRTGADVVLRQPFVRRFPFAEGWTDENYTDLMAEWNIYAPHEVPEMRVDPAEAAVIALQRELIRGVGDSVATGLLSVKTAAWNGGNAAPGAAAASGSAAIAASEIDILTVPPPPTFQLATPPNTPTDAAVRVNGQSYALPLSSDAIAAIAAAALRNREARVAQGAAPVDGPAPHVAEKACCAEQKQQQQCGSQPPFPSRYMSGPDLHTPAVGQGTAAAAADTDTVEVLGDLAGFNFPAAKDGVLRALCPDAEDLKAVPWRVEVYHWGEAIAYSTLGQPSGPDEVGAIAVNLPVCADYERGMTRFAHKEMMARFDPDRTIGTFESGEHRFYAGRALATQNPEIPLDAIHNMKDTGFDRPSAAAVLETRVALTEYTAVEVTNAMGVRPLKYVAWTHDTVFEALPVLAPVMVVLRYKVFKGAPRKVWHVPRREHVLHLAHTAFTFMALRPNPTTLLPEFPNDPAFLRPVHIGLILRHAYESADLVKGVDDPPSVLRGLDAVAYRILSGAFECRLIPAIVYKSDCHCAAWRVQEFPHRFVFASTKGYPELRQETGVNLSDAECMPLLVSALENTVVNCLWAQIGNGRLLGGGGNAYDECVCDSLPDCGTDWWYQNAVLVVMPEPARWARRKPLFSIRDRSADRPADGRAEPCPRTVAGALAHWHIMETIAMFL